MDEKNLKARKKLTTAFLILLGIAFVLIGFVAYRIFSDKNEAEAVDLSELTAGGSEIEGQYVKLEFDAMPVVMASSSQGESQLYFITDENDDIYIADISNETMKSIIETFDQETGKLNAPYELKGVTGQIDEQIKGTALTNGYRLFKNNELNEDNFSDYLGGIYVKEKVVSERVVTLYKIIAMTGVFFLVLAFGYVVPAMVKAKKGDFGIMDENKMMQGLRKNLPYGETLASGVHSIGLETEIKMIFEDCVYDGDMTLIPCENSPAIQVTKGKKARFDVYAGISQNYLILSECERYKHYYAFDEVYNWKDANVEKIKERTSLNDIGNCFPLTEIQSFETKKMWMGAIQCTITMKNGSYLKLMIPKRGGMGIPDHEKYREAFLARLSSLRL